MSEMTGLDMKIYDSEAVAKLFPESLKIKPKIVEEHARDTGNCLDIGGKIAFTEKDVERLIISYRVAGRLAGPMRLLTGKFDDEQRGLLVFIGLPWDAEEAVYVGWVPNGLAGSNDLLRLINFGHPIEQHILLAAPATHGEAETIRTDLEKLTTRWRTNWFNRNEAMNDLLQSIGEKLREYEEPDMEDDTGKDRLQ